MTALDAEENFLSEAECLNSTDPMEVGRKALGLSLIPAPWRPPFFVVRGRVYGDWLKAGHVERDDAMRAVSRGIADKAQLWAPQWPFGIILRSSASNESLRDRGAFESRDLTADFDAERIARQIRKLFEQYESALEHGRLAIVVQPRAKLLVGGHLSNERRVSKTINQWEYESNPPSVLGGRFNSQRADAPAETQSLQVLAPRELLPFFRSIGKWCTGLKRGRTHLEWGWTGELLWLFQLDLEDDAPDNGLDPRVPLRDGDARPPDDPPYGSPWQVACPANGKSGWKKIDNVRKFIEARKDPFPRLHYITGETYEAHQHNAAIMSRDFELITHGRGVIRTDCTSPLVSNLDLPRTDSADGSVAHNFLHKTYNRLRSSGAQPNEICFIMHKFIPARAAAWARAYPNDPLVMVDSLWGVPDGLQFLPHDNFQYDVRRGVISAERIRFKPRFVQETVGGQWKEILVGRKFARSKSLSAAEVQEVASQTYQLALNARHGVSVMWFCGVPDAVGIGVNVPWFMVKVEASVQGSRLERRGPARSNQVRRVANLEDIAEIESYKGREPLTLLLEPTVEYIRDRAFLDRIIVLAKNRKWPVMIHGSKLCHAYYILEKEGVSTLISDEPLYYRVRGRRQFYKIVRDEIPAKIAEHGERPVIARIAKQESRAALLTKLYEEAYELGMADSPHDVKMELADLVEVIRSFCSATGVPWTEVLSAADDKRQTRGSFEDGVVLLETSWAPSDSEDGARTVTIPLSKLARIEKNGATIDMTYAVMVSSSSNSVIRISDERGIIVNFTSSGLQIREVELDRHSSEAQLRFDL